MKNKIEDLIEQAKVQLESLNINEKLGQAFTLIQEAAEDTINVVQSKFEVLELGLKIKVLEKLKADAIELEVSNSEFESSIDEKIAELQADIEKVKEEDIKDASETD